EKTAYTVCSLSKIKGASWRIPRGRQNLFVGPQPRLQNIEGIAFYGVVHHHDAALGCRIQELVLMWGARPDRVRPARGRDMPHFTAGDLAVGEWPYENLGRTRSAGRVC